MNIAFLGNFRPRTALGEPFSTESHLAATYELMGHQVLRLQEDETLKRSIPERCQAFGANLFHWVDTWHSDYPGAFWMLDELRRLGIPSVGYTLDLFVGLSRAPLLDADPWFRTDYFFSPDGDHDEVFSEKGITHFWMPPGCFEPECYLAEPMPELVQDIAFVGSLGYHREYKHRPQLIEWLHQTYGPRFTHYDHGSKMRGHRLNQLYASVRVLIGDSCLINGQKKYCSDRVPESTGRGGFLIHPQVAGVTDGTLYTSGQHLATWPHGEWDCLRDRIDYYLEHHEEREQIRLAGHEHTKQHHTYTRRVERILEIVFGGQR